MVEHPSIEIVACGQDDLAVLLEVGLQAFSEAFESLNNKADYDAYVAMAFDPAVLAAELAIPASEFYFAKVNDQVAGYLKVNHPPVQQEDFGNKCLEIQRIYCLSDYYGQGVGNALMQQSIEIARAHHYDFIWLGVWEHNPRAIRFYQKQGFEVFSSHPFLFGSDLQTDLLMRKFL